MSDSTEENIIQTNEPNQNEDNEDNEDEDEDDDDDNIDYHHNNSVVLYQDNFMPAFYPLFYNMIENELLETTLQNSLTEYNNIQRTEEFINFSFFNYDEDLIQEETKDCSICLNIFKNGEQITKTNCNHIFHNSCITEWTRYKKNCPNCRNINL